jgi:tRNA-Thr(GGU) m(6)t(6)A37 methyltransferase TsaA
MKPHIVTPIGSVHHKRELFTITVTDMYRQGLQQLNTFSHILVLWWCHQTDSESQRMVTVCEKPYHQGPDKVGVFATRSAIRPNPIAVTIVPVLSVDVALGTIHIPYIDAEDGSPVLDIKPYLPCSERVREAKFPEWCAHWPSWYEENPMFNLS